MVRLAASSALLLVFLLPQIVTAAPLDAIGSTVLRQDPVAHHDRAEGDDDDDDDDSVPSIRAAAANLDASPPVLLLAGVGFCDGPRVRVGTDAGTLEELVVFNAGDNLVQAGLAATHPGTYRVTLSCPDGADSVDVTIGATGPPGPPGRDGILAGQSCPAGTVALGFALDGTLLCSQRPPVDGTCPCFSDAGLAALAQVIVDTSADAPDEGVLSCFIADAFIAIDFGRYPASGADPTEVDVFARDDTCGVRTWLPGKGIVENVITPIAPDEAIACSAAILETAQSLGCL